MSRRVDGVLMSLPSRRVARARPVTVWGYRLLILLAAAVTLSSPGCTVWTNYLAATSAGVLNELYAGCAAKAL